MGTLDARVQEFSKRYIPADAIKPIELDEVGSAHLKSILDEAGYQRLGVTSMYRRLTFDKKTNNHKIDIFDISDVVKKGPGFSYIELKDPNETDNYLAGRETRFKWFKREYRVPGLYGSLAGLIGGGIADIIGMVIDKNTGGHISNWWLLAPPLLLGVGTWACNYLSNKISDRELQKKIDAFLGTYQNRITTGKDAILKALIPGTKTE